MSAHSQQVTHPLFGPAEVVDREWAPKYGRPDREIVTLDVDGVTVRAEAGEVES